MHEDSWQGNKAILEQNMEKREHDRKAEWINSIERELGKHEEGPKVKLHFNLLRATLKKVQNWKTPGLDTGLKNSHPSKTDWQ